MMNKKHVLRFQQLIWFLFFFFPFCFGDMDCKFGRNDGSIYCTEGQYHDDIKSSESEGELASLRIELQKLNQKLELQNQMLAQVLAQKPISNPPASSSSSQSSSLLQNPFPHFRSLFLNQLPRHELPQGLKKLVVACMKASSSVETWRKCMSRSLLPHVNTSYSLAAKVRLLEPLLIQLQQLEYCFDPAHLLQETLQTKEELLFGRAYRFIDSEHAPPVKQQFPWLGPGNFWEFSTAQVHEKIWDLLPVSEVEIRAMFGKTCAVVSGSAALKGAGFGQEIDQHDIVVRFHDAPTFGYENDVGSKTTFRVASAFILMDWARNLSKFEHLLQDVAGFWYPFNQNHQANANKERGLYYEAHKSLVTLSEHYARKDENDVVRKLPIYLLTQRAIEHLHFCMEAIQPNGKYSAFQILATSGMRTIYGLVPYCRELNIYGFERNVITHYFDTQVSGKKIKADENVIHDFVHDIDTEYDFYEVLQNMGLLRYRKKKTQTKV